MRLKVYTTFKSTSGLIALSHSRSSTSVAFSMAASTEGEMMDLAALVELGKRKIEDPGGGGEEGRGAKSRRSVAEAADAAEDTLHQVEGALKAKDVAAALSLLLKGFCMHSQLLRDLASVVWVSVILPTLSPIIVACRAAGKLYAEAAGLPTVKDKLGPPHLHMARAGFKCLVEAETSIKIGGEAMDCVKSFYQRFVLSARMQELGLSLRHFRCKKCYNEDMTRLQFAVVDGVSLQFDSGGEPVTYSKLMIENAVVVLLRGMGGALKQGTAPQGHLETLAQKMLDRHKLGGKGRGKDKKEKA